jgi:hypothetical protein
MQNNVMKANTRKKLLSMTAPFREGVYVRPYFKGLLRVPLFGDCMIGKRFLNTKQFPDCLLSKAINLNKPVSHVDSVGQSWVAFFLPSFVYFVYMFHIYILYVNSTICQQLLCLNRDFFVIFTILQYRCVSNEKR